MGEINHTAPTTATGEEGLREALEAALIAEGGKLDAPGQISFDVPPRADDPTVYVDTYAVAAALAQAPAVQAPAGEDEPDHDLWCMHVHGPDELFAAPDFWTALVWAAELNACVASRAVKQEWAKDDNWPRTQAVVARWPWPAEDHAGCLTKELALRAAHESRRKAASPTPTDAQPKAASPVGEEALRGAVANLREKLTERDNLTEKAERGEAWWGYANTAHLGVERAEASVVVAALAAYPTGQQTLATPRDGGVREAPDLEKIRGAYSHGLYKFWRDIEVQDATLQKAHEAGLGAVATALSAPGRVKPSEALWDTQPNIGSGPEPSLRSITRSYFAKEFSLDEAVSLADRHIATHSNAASSVGAEALREARQFVSRAASAAAEQSVDIDDEDVARSLAGWEALVQELASRLASHPTAGQETVATPQDEILRVTIVVRANTTATQLTFAPGTKFECGADAVRRAVQSLEAERAESVNCPAWKSDFSPRKDDTTPQDGGVREALSGAVMGLLRRTAVRGPNEPQAHLFPDEARQILAALSAPGSAGPGEAARVIVSLILNNPDKARQAVKNPQLWGGFCGRIAAEGINYEVGKAQLYALIDTLATPSPTTTPKTLGPAEGAR